ncbi:hypothetical protein G6F31_019493 [Rhizopus arrhizus]|nr:hypothetical protein G6F31_019493 [Rhizopus arrhizus]
MRLWPPPDPLAALKLPNQYRSAGWPTMGRGGRRRRRIHRSSFHQVLEPQCPRQACRRTGGGRHQRPAGRPTPDRGMARPADLDRQAGQGDPRCAARTGWPPQGPRVRREGPAAGLRAEAEPRAALDQAGHLRAGRPVHAPGLLA